MIMADTGWVLYSIIALNNKTQEQESQSMNRSRQISLLLKILSIVLVTGIAWALRERAVNKLPVDYDEDDYMRAAQEFAQLIRAEDWAGFQNTNYRTEHPPLAKILFGVSLLSAPEKPLIADRPTTAEPDKYLPRQLLLAARTLGQIFGTITVFLLSLFDPIAGLFLASHAMTIKYDSQVMLEALPALTSFIMVTAYRQGRRKNDLGWLIVSAIFLGLTAASKYLYCIVAIAILIDWYFAAKRTDDLKSFYRNVILWGAISIAIFIAADPYLWPNPIERLTDSVLYHAGYSTGAGEVEMRIIHFGNH